VVGLGDHTFGTPAARRPVEPVIPDRHGW
jgi:hypothetical protein